MPRSLGPALAAALVLTLAGPGAAGEADEPAASSEQEAAEALRRKRRELDDRREKLPEPSRAAMRLLDRFRDKEFRLWSTSRVEVVNEGAAAVPALLIALEETDWETRAFAASCLADLREPSAAGALADAYEKETKFAEARRQFVLALASIRSQASKPTLLEAAKSPDAGIRLAAVRGLAAYRDAGLKDALRTCAADDDLDIRYEARGGLAALDDAETIASLVEETKALVRDRDSERVTSLAISDNGDRYAQYLLGLALARADRRKDVDAMLEDILTSEKPWRRKSFLRMGAAEGLGRRSAEEGRVDPRLATGLTHKDDEVRVACSYAAGWVGSPELLPKLKEALGDAQMDVRYNAATALGRITRTRRSSSSAR
jgi:HEAT repeat protein